MDRYLGRITSVPVPVYGFVGLDTVCKEGGSPHNLSTTKDIYIHRSDCSFNPTVGAWTSFEVIGDRMRNDALRAINADPAPAPLLQDTDAFPAGPVAEAEPETSVVDTTLVPEPTEQIPPGQSLVVIEQVKFPAAPVRPPMKDVPRDLLVKVAKNHPLPGVPRHDARARTVDDVLLELLPVWFAHISYFGREIEYNSPDETIQKFMSDIDRRENTSFLSAQRRKVRADLQNFLAVRRSLNACLAFMSSQGLVREDTILPINLLPDIFMPAPVWYFRYTLKQTAFQNKRAWFVHPRLRRICDLIPSSHWATTFLLFNRRLRTFNQYNGEVIHTDMADRINQAGAVFDEVVIATPYLDQAGSEWQKAAWQGGIDPFVYAFKADVPLIFILGRLSGTETFDLYDELVADTIAFLRAHGKLAHNFARKGLVRSSYWYWGKNNLWRSGRTWIEKDDLGNPTKNIKAKAELAESLEEHTSALTTAFDRGMMFGWLRENK